MSNPNDHYENTPHPDGIEDEREPDPEELIAAEWKRAHDFQKQRADELWKAVSFLMLNVADVAQRLIRLGRADVIDAADLARIETTLLMAVLGVSTALDGNDFPPPEDAFDMLGITGTRREQCLRLLKQSYEHFTPRPRQR
jgi:hypothetical protein